ncbi:glycosyltransferase [Pleurocapsa sp. PCC 7327]|uniref:glycosyltransferase family 4 protein n=1 Tax=Pleurocapsa sp. PCC 7327 TaxID=118163 RepID=UPI00029FA7BB|nr:glycosyltransferase family 4 protein [Pleurocapsa sp. PCC 7327]AFY79495.1 glycosyltransferase [Pleurocapsa sp. PCC 7327]
MKIAYVLPRLKYSGMTRIAFLLATNLAKTCDIKVFYFGETSPSEKILNFKVPVQKIKFTEFCHELNDYNIIHSHGLKPDLYIYLNKNKINATAITTIHGYHIEELSYDRGLIFALIFGNIWNFACRNLDLAVCISQTMEEHYQKLGFNNTKTIYNGIQVPIVNSAFNKNNISNHSNRDYIKISTVSILNKRKGIEQIIKLLKINKNCYLIAIGGNEKDINRLRNLASELGVTNRCNFVGYKENPWETAIHSDVFIFPSRSEGCPLALTEAAALEIPILCSDIPTFREMFEEDEVTFFKLDDIDDLNQKIIKLNEIKTKVIKAKLKVKEKFDVEQMCRNYFQLYLELTKSKLQKNMSV